MRKTKIPRRVKKIIYRLALVAVLCISVNYLVQNIGGQPESSTTSITDHIEAATDKLQQLLQNSTDEVEETELEEATVVRVVDGDTLVVDLSGEEYYVRLIGVDTPESVHPDDSKNTEEGEEASEYTKSLVAEGSSIYLQKDTSDTDTYGRLLRYVWLEEPTDTKDLEEIKTKMLNAILIINGYAEPKEYEPDTAYADIFESLA